MEWRELLYCAFPESFRWVGDEMSAERLEDLHEYAVFLRSRFDIIQLQQQIGNLGFVMENLIDTYDWDPRGTEEFLEWLNPFNDSHGSPANALEIAEELAEEMLLRGTVEEGAVAHLLALMKSLPRLSDGRLVCFDALDALQQLAVRRWIQEFAVRYLTRLNWVAQLELAMARLYWEYAPTKGQLSSIKALCRERLQHYSRLSASSSWARFEQIKISRQEEQSSYYGWYPPEGFEGFVNQFAPSAELPMQARKDFTRILRGSMLQHEQSWETLYGWVGREEAIADCLYTPWGLQLHSSRLREIMEQLGLLYKVRYLPVHLVAHATQREVAIYYAAFYQVRLSCMSRNRTIGIWNQDFTTVLDSHRPALIGSQIAGEELFVVTEYEPLVVVSRRIRDIVVKEAALGCEFKPILVVDE